MFKAAIISTVIATVPLFGCAAPGLQPRPQLSTSSEFISALAQSTRRDDVTITPTALLEDSRCPANANCVQAGTVRLQVTIEEGSRKRISEVGLGKPLATGGALLHLVRVCPHPIAPISIPLGQYRFHFVLAGSAVSPTAAADCT